MTKRNILSWWAYGISMVLAFGFIVPYLISAAFTPAVILGILVILLMLVWTYYQWVKPLFTNCITKD